jgi:uncharacterized GH25 family protein
MNKKTLWLLIGLISLTGGLWAHDVWLVPKGDYLELLYGHETPEVYNPVKVTQFQGYDQRGNLIPLEKKAMPQAFALKKNPRAAMITLTFDNGYWVAVSSSSPWLNVTEQTARTFPAYSNPVKFHKSIYVWGPALAKPAGMKFEIVPLQDPFKASNFLPVQVLFDGKPLTAAKVEYGLHGDTAPSVISDAEGKAMVPVTSHGEQFIAVDHSSPAPVPGQPRKSYTTSLRYEPK